MMKKRIFEVLFGEKKVSCGVKENKEGLFVGAKLGEEEPVVAESIDICEAEDIEDEVITPVEVEDTAEAVVTLLDAFNRYIFANQEALAASTIKSIVNIRDKHMQGLMNMNVFDISDDDIQLALYEEIKNGISDSTIKRYRRTVKKVIAFCD